MAKVKFHITQWQYYSDEQEEAWEREKKSSRLQVEKIVRYINILRGVKHKEELARLRVKYGNVVYRFIIQYLA